MKPLLFRLSLVGCLVGALFAPSLRAATTSSNPAQSFPLVASRLVSDSARNLVYASISGENTIAVINPTTLAVSKQIVVNAYPLGMAISPDGTKLFVTLSGAPQIAIIDLHTETVLPSLTIETEAYSIAAGLGDRLYVTTSDQTGRLLQINALTGATEGVLDSGNSEFFAGFLQINPARTELFYGNDSLVSAVYRFDVSGPTADLSQMTQSFIGFQADDLKLSHNGALLAYATEQGTGATPVIDPENLSIQYGSFNVDVFPGPLTFSPDDKIAYEVDAMEEYLIDKIYVFDTASFVSLAPLPVAYNFVADLVTNGTGRYLFVAGSSSIDVYDLYVSQTTAATAVQGTAFSYAVPLFVSPDTFTATGLPSGLTLNIADRTITGVATENGVFPVLIKATHGAAVLTVNLTLTVYANSRALNISTRALVQPGDGALIAGFIIVGSQDQAKSIVVRALGPSLSVSGIPLAGQLMDPTVTVYDSTHTQVGSNDNWLKPPPGKVDILAQLHLAPKNALESALLLYLSPGAYTAVVSGVNNTSGIALVEVYDVDGYNDPGDNKVARLANISTRGLVEAGDNVMIGGVIIGGPAQATMLLRGLGPSLSAHGVKGVLADPQLTLYNSDGTQISSNNNWQDSQEQKIEATGLAPTNPLESAIDITLAPGAYTAILRGVNNGTGVGQIEAYNLP